MSVRAWRDSRRGEMSTAKRGRRKGYSQSVFEVFVDLHNGCLVAAPVAVVWCAEDGDDIAVLTPVVPFHDQLVGSRHQCQAVVVVERF